MPFVFTANNLKFISAHDFSFSRLGQPLASRPTQAALKEKLWTEKQRQILPSTNKYLLLSVCKWNASKFAIFQFYRHTNINWYLGITNNLSRSWHYLSLFGYYIVLYLSFFSEFCLFLFGNKYRATWGQLYWHISLSIHPHQWILWLCHKDLLLQPRTRRQTYSVSFWVTKLSHRNTMQFI